jgi:dsDNA-specific endonuclease/ATPase MutS2
MTDASGNVYNMWDLDSVKYLYKQMVQYEKAVKDLESTDSSVTRAAIYTMANIREAVGYTSNNEFDVKEFRNFLMRKLQDTLSAVSKKQVVKLNGFDT